MRKKYFKNSFAGSSNYMIHLAGVYALNQIKISQQLETISDLIHQNSDYLTYYINKSLKTVSFIRFHSFEAVFVFKFTKDWKQKERMTKG